ncbi:MAG: hypothetical protein RL748_2564 [Pseudomonadota bacterium]
MTRIAALNPSDAPANAQPLLAAVEKKLGIVPNLFKTFAHSPAVLASYLAQTEALAGGVLRASLREQIALVTAGTNQCDYCASAHTLLGKGAGVSATEAALNLHGQASDSKVQAALTFANAIIDSRGRVSDAHLAAVREAGYNEAEIVEIIAHVSLNIFTNYFNFVANTEIDFPLVKTA